MSGADDRTPWRKSATAFERGERHPRAEEFEPYFQKLDAKRPGWRDGPDGHAAEAEYIAGFEAAEEEAVAAAVEVERKRCLDIIGFACHDDLTLRPRMRGRRDLMMEAIADPSATVEDLALWVLEEHEKQARLSDLRRAEAVRKGTTHAPEEGG